MTNSDRVIPFPCATSAELCVQSERLAKLEAHDEAQTSAISRVEGKVDRILWWLMGLVVAVAGGAIAALLSVLLKGRA